MRYRRALLVIELGADPRPALSSLRRVAPALVRLVVAASLPAPTLELVAIADAARGRDAGTLLAGLERTAAGAAPDVSIQLVPELGGDAIAAICDAEAIDLLVAGAPWL